MRDRLQIESTVSQFHDAKRRERANHLAQLIAILEKSHDEDWYVWVLARRDNIHRHDLRQADGKPCVCPVRGCGLVGSVAA